MGLLILFIIAVCLLVYAVKVSRKNREESEKYQTAETPTHFDLLDDNGDPDAPAQELRYFCVKDKGYHVSVWPKDQGIPDLDYIEFNIAGITHGEHIDDHLGEFVATLDPDPANPYDAKAIKILASNGDRVGYVPKDMTDEIRAFTQMPCKCYCYIGINNGTYYSCCYISKDEC